MADTLAHFAREDLSVLREEEPAQGASLPGTRVLLHHWPSWLRKGGPRGVKHFLEFFYV